MKKLLKITYNRKDDQNAINFIKTVSQLVKDSFEYYVKNGGSTSGNYRGSDNA